MGSQFKEIILASYLEQVIDELTMHMENSLELAKSETTKTVLELGYKSCLNDLYLKMKREGILFVDRDNIHTSESGHIPYEDDSLTDLTVHKDLHDYTALTYADELPDTVYIRDIKFLKGVDD